MQSTSWGTSGRAPRASNHSALLLSLLSLAPAPLVAQGVSVKDASDVLDKWSPDKQLYVQGNVGVSAGNLRRLEEALKAHPNWTVILMSKVSGHRFNEGGVRKEDYEAVEYILGTKLQNTTDFGAVPRGAFLIISFEDPPFRKVGYFGGPDWDKFGLGEESIWKGDVDQIAIRHLKNGRDVFGAVTGVIEEIEGRFARHPGPGQAAAAVKNVETLITQYAALATAAKVAHPRADGDLLSLDVEAARTRLKTVSENQDFSRVRADAEKLGEELRQPVEALRQHAADEAALEQLGQSLVASSDHRLGGFVARDVAQGRERLEAAKTSWERVDSSYSGALQDARRVAEHAAGVLRKAEIDEGSIRTEGERLKALSTSAFAAFGAAGFRELSATQAKLSSQFTNRDPLYNGTLADFARGISTLANALDTVSGDGERLGALSKRLNEAKESAYAEGAEAELRNAEDSLQVARAQFNEKSLDYQPRLSEAIEYVNSAWQIIDAAERSDSLKKGATVAAILGLLGTALGAAFFANRRPGRLSARARGEALLSRYEAFLSEKASQVNTFPGKAETVLDEFVTERTAGDTRKLADEATESLGMLLPLYSEISRRVALAREALHPSSPAARFKAGFSAKGFERAVQLLTEDIELDPNSELAASLKEQTGGKDRAWSRPAKPITMKMDDVIDNYNANGQRAEDALRAIEEAHLHVGTCLKEVGAANRVLLIGVAELAGRSTTETTQSIAKGLKSILEDEQGLFRQAEKLELVDPVGAVRLTKAATEQLALLSSAHGCTTQVVESYVELMEVREALAKLLEVSADSVLNETDGDPFASLENAAREVAAALESFRSTGDTDGIRARLDAAELGRAQAVTQARGLVKLAVDYPTVHAELEAIVAGYREGVPQLVARLQSLKETYGSESLKLGKGDPTHPNANGTVSDNVEEVEKSLRLIAGGLKKGETLRAAGQLVALEKNTARLRAALAFVGSRMAEVEEKAARLGEIDTENSLTHGLLQEKLEKLRDDLALDETSTATIKAAEGVTNRLSELKSELTARGRSPLDTMEELAQLEQTVDGLAEAIQRDKSFFEEAKRSLAVAKKAIHKVQSSLETAVQDDIPDSRRIEDEVPGELKELQTKLAKLETTLDVPHSDWGSLDGEIDGIFDAATKLSKVVAKEIKSGEEAAAQIAAAATSLKAARKVNASSVRNLSLDLARTALTEANYADALSHASSVQRAADKVVEAARIEAERLARIEAERLATLERQRRERERERRAELEWSVPSLPSGRSGGSDSGSDVADVVSGVVSSVISIGSGVSSSDW